MFLENSICYDDVMMMILLVVMIMIDNSIFCYDDDGQFYLL